MADKEELINIGHIKEIHYGEEAQTIMKRFAMPKKDFMFLNVDMSRQQEAMWASSLPVGMSVCIVPNSCGSMG